MDCSLGQFQHHGLLTAEQQGQPMTQREIESAGRRLASDIMKYHTIDRANPDKQNAAIVKCVALVSLAFNMNPIAGAPLDIDDALDKLRKALDTLAR